jgi:hypothetical protein
MTSLPELQNQLARLRAPCVAGRQALLQGWKPALADADYAQDAGNLAAYIAFRREDLRDLQERLSDLGLSSLGRCEGHVEATLDAVALALDAIMANPSRQGRSAAAGAEISGGRQATETEHPASAGQGAEAAARAHHGHPAHGGGPGCPVGARSDGTRHGHRPHQLRP